MTERHVQAAALARRLCQMFDAGGESQRTVRARHASAIFQLLACDTPEQREEYRKCDADPVEYLQAIERMAAERAAGLIDNEVTDVAWAILQSLHENVPEDDRPMSWSDVNGNQEQRIRAAAVAAIECIRNRK